MAEPKAAIKPLIDFLIERDGPAYLHELPKPMQDPKVLNLAWIEGMIEFGRRHTTETGVPSKDNMAHEKRLIIEDGISWSGQKRNIHKPLRDLLKEEEMLPVKCVALTKVQDEKTKEFRVESKEHKGDLLRLQIRLTDKAFAMLAGA